jgi:hypothetical protein
VFQDVPQALKGGSGSPNDQKQHQRLDAVGRQLQRGHLIPLRSSSSSCNDASTMTRSEASVSLNNTQL